MLLPYIHTYIVVEVVQKEKYMLARPPRDVIGRLFRMQSGAHVAVCTQKRLKTGHCRDDMMKMKSSSLTSDDDGGIEIDRAALPPQRLSVAPMMDYTDVHFRQLVRLMSRNTWLYTEMVVDKTLIFNPDHDRFLWFPPEQRPVSCQLGGSDPESLAKAATIVASYGYDEINLNSGCPSDRVAGAGCFGAAMMLQPALVADCCAAMADAVPHVPITVKCRIGVDDVDSYDSLHEFIRVVSENSPVKHFIIHARKCLLKGLSPHQNRTIPPLRYEWLLGLKRDFPKLDFSLNGGILTLEETLAALNYPFPSSGGSKIEAAEEGEGATIEEGGQQHTEGISGVMVGRAAYSNPWTLFGAADVDVWGASGNPCKSRRELLYKYAAYADSVIGKWQVKEDGYKSPNVRVLTKPLFGLFAGEPRGKKWRAAVDTALKTATTVTEILDKTLGVLFDETLDAAPQVMDRPPSTLEECSSIVPGLTAEPPTRSGEGVTSATSSPTKSSAHQ